MDYKTQEQLSKLERMKTASLISESEYKELRTKILTDELNNDQTRIQIMHFKLCLVTTHLLQVQ